MKSGVFTFLVFLGILCHSKLAEGTFGYLTYSTHNIGDDIQEIAAKQFLPSDSVGIDRDDLSRFTHNGVVNAILNGWFMHTKSWGWGELAFKTRGIPPPEKSWPPSSAIDPLIISFHITRGVIPEILTEEGIAYLKKHAPIGARDYATMRELQMRGIPSYFSGCLTLALKNPASHRGYVIYAVNLDAECVNYLRSQTHYPVISVSHHIGNDVYAEPVKREERAQQLLQMYGSAKCVITNRLHAAMPCLALETPVLLVNTQQDQYRFEGLKELVRHCSRYELLNGLADFDINHPPSNPTDYIPIRENLIRIVNDWVRIHTSND